jgi:hypothetical protein
VPRQRADHREPEQRQQREIGVADREDAAEHHRLDLVDVEALGHRHQQADAEPERHGEEHADQRVGRQRGAALRVHHRDGAQQAEAEDAAVGRVERLAEHEADRQSGERRLAEGRAEKREPPSHHEMAHAAEQGPEEEEGEVAGSPNG